MKREERKTVVLPQVEGQGLHEVQRLQQLQQLLVRPRVQDPEQERQPPVEDLEEQAILLGRLLKYLEL